jgi:hypothetical protein
MDIDSYWEQLPIRQMSMIEYKKKFFILNVIDLKDLQTFNRLFVREELLLAGSPEIQNIYREMFIDYAKENDIYKLIFSFLILCRNDESIDKIVVMVEMNKLLNLKIINENTDKSFYMTKDTYRELLEIYIKLVSEHTVKYLRKIKNANVEADLEKIFSKENREKLIEESVNGIVLDGKIHLKVMVKTDWPFLCDDSLVRDRLLQLHLNNSRIFNLT